MFVSPLLTTILLALPLSSARPVNSRLPRLSTREVPQEHSHQQFLTTVTASLALSNPDGIVDPVFGLLGNAAAAAGLGKLTDTECLQTSTADQAFTNAKAAADVPGMTAALIYRALERNTGKVGLQSNACTSVVPVNAEIAALSQHQDPASAGAAATNKAITLALAQQIASIGGTATDALKSGTFAPGQLTDNTGKGNTCDVANDAQGCIFTQNLLVEDATADEVAAAVAGGAASAAATPAAGAVNSTQVAAAGNSTQVAATSAAAKAPCKSVAAAGAGSVASSSAAAAAAPVASSSAQASAVASTTTTAPATGALDFGDASCSDPAIAFQVGFDGRTEASFEPDDTAVFQHNSALSKSLSIPTPPVPLFRIPSPFPPTLRLISL